MPSHIHILLCEEVSFLRLPEYLVPRHAIAEGQNPSPGSLKPNISPSLDDSEFGMSSTIRLILRRVLDILDANCDITKDIVGEASVRRIYNQYVRGLYILFLARKYGFTYTGTSIRIVETASERYLAFPRIHHSPVQVLFI